MNEYIHARVRVLPKHRKMVFEATIFRFPIVFASRRGFCRAAMRPQAVACNFPSRRNALIGIVRISGIVPMFLDLPAFSAVIKIESGAPGERDVVVLSSGVQYADIRKGSGELPRTGSLVVCIFSTSILHPLILKVVDTCTFSITGHHLAVITTKTSLWSWQSLLRKHDVQCRKT